MPNSEFNMALLEAGLSNLTNRVVCFGEQGGDIDTLYSWSLAERYPVSADTVLRVQEQGDLLLFVRLPVGKSIPVRVSSSQVVADVKRVVHVEEKIPPDMQRIIFAGRQLEDGRTLQDYGIPTESVLHVVLRLRGGSNVIALQKNCLDPKFDFDFTKRVDDGSVAWRGCELYKRPFGWYRYALKVVGKYKDEAWLGLDGMRNWSCDGEWPVSYHGTSLHNGVSIAQAGYDLSKGKRHAHGFGIYTSPSLEVAQQYAHRFQHCGKTYLLVIQNRVNPKTLKKSPGVTRQSANMQRTAVPHQIWLNEAKEDVRAYGLLIKKPFEPSVSAVSAFGLSSLVSQI